MKDTKQHITGELSKEEKRRAANKAYYELNREKLAAKCKEYYKTNSAQLRAYRESHCSKEQCRIYYELNKEHIKEKCKAYYKDNKEELNASSRAYNSNNKEQLRKKRLIYRNKRIKKDELYAAKTKLRNLVSNAFIRIKFSKPAKTEVLLGCSWQEAKEHMENLFLPGMTWANHGEWHIDHKVPIASATTIEEAIALNHISNLQPLWAKDNILKRDKL